VVASARAVNGLEQQADYFFKTMKGSGGVTADTKKRFINPESTAADFTIEEIKGLTNFEQVDNSLLQKL
jgi:hypothetical protein